MQLSVQLHQAHPISEELAANNPELKAFIEECNQIANTEEALEKAEKKGFDTGLKIKHPFIDGRITIIRSEFHFDGIWHRRNFRLSSA